mgnify:CR=1 FL=1|jgi:hypothetical protein
MSRIEPDYIVDLTGCGSQPKAAAAVITIMQMEVTTYMVVQIRSNVYRSFICLIAADIFPDP